MNRLRSRWWLPLVLVTLAVAGAEVWCGQRLRERSARALGRLQLAVAEREDLARLMPAPSAENEARLAQAIAVQRARIAELRDQLGSGTASWAADPAPRDSMEAFFSLAALTEWARARADAGRVAVRPDERFGFSSYANAGPPAALLEAVHRQQAALQTVLATLFEARPQGILGVRREPPAPGAFTGEDYFTIEPGRSLRQPGLVDTQALKLEFTGHTATLRDLLNGLAMSRDPVVVRSIDVEPLRASDHGERVPIAAATEAPVAVVRRSLSKFVVTVEFIVLPAPPVPPPS